MAANYDQEQRTLDWYRSRLGLITGSKVSTIMSKGRAKEAAFSQTGIKYLYQVAAERLLSKQMIDDDYLFQYYVDQTSHTTKAMDFGIMHEPEARSLYCEITGNKVVETGLCKHPDKPHLASSPDGIVVEGATQGCLEIKCPSPSTYAEYSVCIKDAETLKSVEPDYYYQCMNHMACTGTAFCDFVAYSPFMEKPMHIVRIARDEDAIAAILEKADLAEAVISNIVKSVNSNQ